MSIDVCIKQKGLFKKTIPLDVIVDDELAFGINDGMRMVGDDQEGNMIFYNPNSIGRGFHISWDEEEKNELNLRLLNPTTTDEMRSFFNCLRRITEDDICYCAMYLSNMTLLDLDFFSECDIIDQETESITLEAVQEINNRLGLNLKKNDDFYQGLSMHFYPAIQRLKNDEQLHDNVLTDKIKTENETEYKCAMILNDVVKEHYHKSFNEDELAYIALHFGTALR